MLRMNFEGYKQVSRIELALLENSQYKPEDITTSLNLRKEMPELDKEPT